MAVPVVLSEIPAFSNRDALIAAVERRLDRADLTDHDIKDYIRLVEGDLNTRLRSPAMETVATVTVSAGAGFLPTDFMQLRAVYDARGCIIEAVEPATWLQHAQGVGKVHCLIGGQLRIAPAADETVTIIYYRTIPALSINQASNWLLDRFPQVYFYGVLAQACSDLGDMENAAVWAGVFDNAVDAVEQDGLRNRFGGPLRQRSTVGQRGRVRV